MKKTIPFKKDIAFKTNLSEITSISLEHTLQVGKDNLISGDFIVAGEYKMVESSVNVEPFSFNIPFEVSIDDRYEVSNIIVDIDDFSYEIINNNILTINIEILIENLHEKPMKKKQEEKKIITEEVREEQPEIIEKEVDRVKEPEKVDEIERETVSLFDKFDSSETYTTYRVYVVKEGDTLDLIIKNYSITHEELEKYNNLSDISIGDKIIIPFVKNEDN